eukprot:ANDGO_02227.mRNA.1 Transcription initiation factor TFIID subunit 7
MEDQFVLRLPPNLADEVREILRKEDSSDALDFELDTSTKRGWFTVRGMGRYPCVLVDLPTVSESFKTFNKRDYIKTATVCQMIVVKSSEDDPDPVMQYPSGLCPPFRNIRHEWSKHHDRLPGFRERLEHLKTILREMKDENVRYELDVEHEEEEEEEEEEGEEEVEDLEGEFEEDLEEDLEGEEEARDRLDGEEHGDLGEFEDDVEDMGVEGLQVDMQQASSQRTTSSHSRVQSMADLSVPMDDSYAVAESRPPSTGPPLPPLRPLPPASSVASSSSTTPSMTMAIPSARVPRMASVSSFSALSPLEGSPGVVDTISPSPPGVVYTDQSRSQRDGDDYSPSSAERQDDAAVTSTTTTQEMLVPQLSQEDEERRKRLQEIGDLERTIEGLRKQMGTAPGPLKAKIMAQMQQTQAHVEAKKREFQSFWPK